MRLDKLTSNLQHEVGMSDSMTIKKEGIRELSNEEVGSVAGGGTPITPYATFVLLTIVWH